MHFTNNCIVVTKILPEKQSNSKRLFLLTDKLE